MNSTDVVLLYCTVPSKAQAQTLAGLLLSARLAACVNLLPGIESHYEWEGNMQCEQEVLLLAKTTRQAALNAVDLLKKSHSYEMPAITILPVEGGNPDFLQWVAAQTES